MTLDPQVKSQIDQLVRDHRVTLFMKGTRHFPQCGFSATVVQILDQLVPEYHTVNVLKDPDIREGIKEYSSWPTIPQLYVDGKFVGGCDIVREMYVAGELQPLLGAEDKSTPPKITVTAAAKKAIEAAKPEGPGMLRLSVSSKFEHELALDDPQKGDFQVDAGGITVLVDRMSSQRADGITIDFVGEERGFSIDNPNEPARVRRVRVQDAKQMIDKGEVKYVLDTRTEDEQSLATIPGSRVLDAELVRELQGLDKGTPLLFYCHHGMRSFTAAQRFAEQGFRNVYNLEGGIDAWSQTVDPTIPRY